MVTGLQFMTEKEINNNRNSSSLDYMKLSIQISLNGLSFCIVDTITNTIKKADSITFNEQLNPFQLLKEVQSFLQKHQVTSSDFKEVIVIHRNNLFGLVPKPLFNDEELANYLKFNVKMLANDHIEYDELKSYDIVNVYVPFININNYLYDLYGEFEFKHHGTVLIETLLQNNPNANAKDAICYVYLSKNEMDIVVIQNKNLIFFNNFSYQTKEDYIYFLLFSLEQLKLETESTTVKLFGAVEEGDEIHHISETYIKDVSISIPENSSALVNTKSAETIDFTVFNAI